MLVDLQLLDISSKPLGSHAAHMVWQQTMMSPELSAMPSVEVSLHQVTPQEVRGCLVRCCIVICHKSLRMPHCVVGKLPKQTLRSWFGGGTYRLL